MTWSKWRWALVLGLLASVGLAWSQSPMTNRQAPAPERIMRVTEENGKTLRCRVLQTWRTAAGAMAYQLQAIDTGEILTIVEDGQPTTVPTSAGGMARALPTRIFHWGQQGVSPTGAPLPPSTPEPAVASGTPKSGIQPASSDSPASLPSPATTIINTPAPNTTSGCNTCTTGSVGGVGRAARGNNCFDSTERIITWEEGNRPLGTKNGGPVIVEGGVRTTGGGPVIVEGSGSSYVPNSSSISGPVISQGGGLRTVQNPVIVEGSGSVGSETIISSQPGDGQPRQPLFPRLFPNRSNDSVIVTQDSSGRPITVPATSKNSSVIVTQDSSGRPITTTVPSSSQFGSALPSKTSTGIPTTTVLSERVIDDKNDKAPTTFRERFSNLFHKNTVTKPAEPKAIDQTTIAQGSTDKKSTTTTTKKEERRPFSTASAPTVLPPPKTNPLAIPTEGSKDGATAKNDGSSVPATVKTSTTPSTTKAAAVGVTPPEAIPPVPTLPAAMPPAATPPAATASITKKNASPPPVPTAPTSVRDTSNKNDEGTEEGVLPGVAKREGPDWRNMWGQKKDTKETKLEQPGQTTVDREKIRTDMPKTSQSEGKSRDILLNPEKFNPSTGKSNPKVTAEMAGLSGLPTPPAAPPVAAVQPTFAQQPFPTAPGITPPAPPTIAKQSYVPQAAPQAVQQAYQPTGSMPTPLGVQSVLSARNGVQGPVQYIPVPVATVPEPVRPPTPPEPNIPEPPNPAMYVNAFSPPLPPGVTPAMYQEFMKQQELRAAMMQQAIMQQAMMQRTQGQFMPPPSAQMIPVGNGMPLQMNIPANYSGPQAPNPVQNTGFVQQTGFNQNVNPAMDRRTTTPTGPTAGDAVNLGQLVSILQESPYPAQREWAAANLATFDWKVYPHLPQVLIQAARQDSAATVRAAAVYSLARMNVQSQPVLSTLQALRGDADPRVRQEVEQAIVRMGAQVPQQ